MKATIRSPLRARIPWAKKEGWLFFFAAITGTAIAGAERSWILSHFGTLPSRFVAFAAPTIAIFILLYLINIACIIVAESAELRDVEGKRWESLLNGSPPPGFFSHATDFVDRAACWRVRWHRKKMEKKTTVAAPIGKVGGTPATLWAVYSDNITALKDRIEVLESELRQTTKGDLPSFVEKLIRVWVKTDSRKRPLREPIYVDDPVYGQFELDCRLAPVFFHPLFQRLNYVRQLSFAYLVFPSASHTRLSHILGSVRNAKAAMRTVFEKGLVYSAEGEFPISLTPAERDRCCLKAQLCALLHDIGHGPFGHALDKLIPYIGNSAEADVPDKTFSITYIQKYLKEQIKQVGFEVDEIVPILDKERRTELRDYDILIADMIDSPLDVDRMDYLVRDGHMTGLGMGYSNIEALIEHMRPFCDSRGNVNLAYEESALPHLQHFLYARDIMYINCYENKYKVCAERLLVRLAEYLLGKGVRKESLMLLTDDQLLTTSDVHP